MARPQPSSAARGYDGGRQQTGQIADVVQLLDPEYGPFDISRAVSASHAESTPVTPRGAASLDVSRTATSVTHT